MELVLLEIMTTASYDFVFIAPGCSVAALCILVTVTHSVSLQDIAALK